MNSETVIKAINNLDLKTLSLESVELLQKMVPTEQESKLYKDFIIEKKNINLLTEEDKYMMNLTKIERISSKLSIMNYMGNFFDSLHLISPVSNPVVWSWTGNWLCLHHFSKSMQSSPRQPRSSHRRSSNNCWKSFWPLEITWTPANGVQLMDSDYRALTHCLTRNPPTKSFHCSITSFRPLGCISPTCWTLTPSSSPSTKLPKFPSRTS